MGTITESRFPNLSIGLCALNSCGSNLLHKKHKFSLALVVLCNSHASTTVGSRGALTAKEKIESDSKKIKFNVACSTYL